MEKMGTTTTVIFVMMRQSNGFESWQQLQLQFARGHRAQRFSFLRTIMQPSWTSETRQFTRQYYNNLKGNIAKNLMMRINQTTTFDDVHQWISNYFNSPYTGTEDNHKAQFRILEKRSALPPCTNAHSKCARSGRYTQS
eukprot:4167785-Amphidinium_carterae.2